MVKTGDPVRKWEKSEVILQNLGTMTTKKSFSDIYDALEDAMRRNSSVSIKYKKLESTWTTRTINPKKFVVLPERQRTKYGLIGVNAFCHHRQDDRTFAVYRIVKLTTQSQLP
jgi:predicted DNA-binding transcriptional regulator YafY